MRFCGQFILVVCLFCLSPLGWAQQDFERAAEVQTVDWDLLMPADWDPMAAFEGIDADALDDADPAAQKALEQVIAAWQDAPMNPDVDHMAIRLPGFIVSLSGEGQAMKEFLLVPTFGACIHVPPPPPNQVIHVVSDESLADYQTMDLVWVSGVITIEQSHTDMAYAGYRMEVIKIEPYRGEEY